MTTWIGYSPLADCQNDNLDPSEAFTRRARSLDGVRVSSRFRGVDLVPATLALEAVLQTAIAWEGREYVLLDMLTPHLAEYDRQFIVKTCTISAVPH